MSQDFEFESVTALIGYKFVDAAIAAIESAEKEIAIVVYDWRFYPLNHRHPVMRFLKALQAARARGVVVRVLNNRESVLATLRGYGFVCKRYHGEKLVHAKMMLIDGRRVLVGSHNYTQSGFSANLEVSLLLDSPELARELGEYFNNLWGV